MEFICTWHAHGVPSVGIFHSPAHLHYALGSTFAPHWASLNKCWVHHLGTFMSSCMHACMHACMLLYWVCCHILGLLLSMHLIAFTITIYVLCCSGLRARTSPLLCVAVYSGCETMASVTMYLVLFTSMQVVTCMQRSTQIFINLLQNIYLF